MTTTIVVDLDDQFVCDQCQTEVAKTVGITCPIPQAGAQ